MFQGVGVAGPSTSPDCSRTLKLFGGIFGRDNITAEEEGFHGDGDQGIEYSTTLCLILPSM